MTSPNTLIFVDLPASDTAAAATFYGEVFGWVVEGRPEGVFHRIVPGGFFAGPDGSDSEVGNLHIGIFDTATAAPDPRPAPVYTGERAGAAPRVYILVGNDDTEAAILERAEARGATILWRNLYWKEFNGFHGAFRDPWGSEVVLWTKGGDNPSVSPDQIAWQPVKGYHYPQEPS
jgi:catechol 2,3-dioxygenase-like lactoylglutathione lyase family enzyme